MSEFNDAREAFISACLTLSLGYGHTDKVRIVFEDVIPTLRGGLRDLEDRLLDLAQAWLAAPNNAARYTREKEIRWISQEKFLNRMADAHERTRHQVIENQ